MRASPLILFTALAYTRVSCLGTSWPSNLTPASHARRGLSSILVFRLARICMCAHPFLLLLGHARARMLPTPLLCMGTRVSTLALEHVCMVALEATSGAVLFRIP